MAVVHLVALELFLYWRFIWLDVPMHILGGIVVVMGIFSCHDLNIPGAAFFVTNGFRVMVFLVMIMVTWEVFEVLIGNPMEDNYVLDTTIDTIMGFVGGFLGLLLAKRMQTL